jgi:thiamine-phosphate pyrophosphorylase
MESKAQKSPRQDERPVPQLYLVTPPVTDAQAIAVKISAVLEAADVAAVLLRLADGDERMQTNRIKILAPVVQKAGAALIVEGHAEIAARGGADGAHLASADDLVEAVPMLKPDRISGASGLHTRHDAMVAAESGADYVMFGEPDANGHRPSREAVLDRVEWWAEVFEIPCVAFVESIEEIGELCAAGADFIAIAEPAFADPLAVAAAMKEATAKLRAKSPA